MEMTDTREESTILESTTSEDSPVVDSQPNGSAERAFQTIGAKSSGNASIGANAWWGQAELIQDPHG